MPSDNKPSPLAEKITFYIRQELASLPEGRPLPPELELADKYGVGRKTVRAAMSVLEREGLIRRVRGKGTFPARGAKAGGLFRSRARRLGVISWVGFGGESERKSFYDLILGGMLKEALDGKGELLIPGGGSREEKKEAGFRLADDPGVDALALISVLDQDFIAELASRGKPVCLVDHYSEKARIDCVRVDSFGSARLAVEHLYNLGHRRIAYMQPSRPDINPSRLEGYRSALGELGLEYRPELVVSAATHPQGGSEAATQLLALEASRRPTAIMAFSDEMAVGAVEGITRFGLRVPDDISVVGAGGGAPVTLNDFPELTSIRFDPSEMGRTAVKYLLERLGDSGIEPRNTVIPTQLRFGESTAPLARDHAAGG